MLNRRGSLVNANTAQALASSTTLQTVVFQCFAELKLDAVVYPTGNVPPAILTGRQEPTVNNRSSGLWTYINARGFPAMTVPAGFTTRVYDRGADGELLPAIPAALPVGIDFQGLPFSEPTLFEIGAAYEAASRHRREPPGFGALGSSGKPVWKKPKGKPRPMPKWRNFQEWEMRAMDDN